MKSALVAGILAISTQGVALPAQQSPVQETNDRFVAQWMGKIEGHENDPAEQFLRIMNAGYSRALGVTCSHCHVEADFSSEDKRPKRAAREMAAMHRMINERLRQMENQQTPSADRAISCSVCHRGSVNPRATGR